MDDIMFSVFKSLIRFLLLTTLSMEAPENISGKGENAENHLFLIFPKYFQHFSRQISIFESHLFLSVEHAFNLEYM